MVCPRCGVAYSLSAYWLGASPQTFYKYYTGKAVVLYGSRFYLYKSKNWHYYMLEFCYFANILLLLEVWVFPNSPTFHKVNDILKLTVLQLSIQLSVFKLAHEWHNICMYAALHHQALLLLACADKHNRLQLSCGNHPCLLTLLALMPAGKAGLTLPVNNVCVSADGLCSGCWSPDLVHCSPQKLPSASQS